MENMLGRSQTSKAQHERQQATVNKLSTKKIRILGKLGLGHSSRGENLLCRHKDLSLNPNHPHNEARNGHVDL